MAKKKRETDDERAARDREERIALLKMKQGLIEDSELIPETGYKLPEPTKWEKFAAFCSLNKWFIIVGAFIAAVVIMCVTQALTKEKADIRVLVVRYGESSELDRHSDRIAQALEKFCRDFDENGKVRVEVNTINFPTNDEATDQRSVTERQRFNAELQLAEAQMLIVDAEFADWMANVRMQPNAFKEQNDENGGKVYNNVGILMNSTALAKEAHWNKCPDSVVILIRNELNDGSGSVKKNAEYRERAEEVLQNILEGNVVNPQD